MAEINKIITEFTNSNVLTIESQTDYSLQQLIKLKPK